jgi:hypothetical protein
MSEGQASTRITVRLDAREPIRGVVEAGAKAKPKSFVGWLGLLKVLEGTLTPGEEEGTFQTDGWMRDRVQRTGNEGESRWTHS